MNYILRTITLAILLAMSSSPALAQQDATTYIRIDVVMDWGAATTHLIADLGGEVQKGAVTADSFSVHVKRSDTRLADPFLEEGMRRVVEAYVSDASGEPVATGRHATLVMEVGPTVSLGNWLNYARDPAAGRNFNAWTENDYAIT